LWRTFFPFFFTLIRTFTHVSFIASDGVWLVFMHPGISFCPSGG
jgi:hypothetical protein